jgi:hypothetical protein
VTAQTFKFVLERDLNTKIQSPATSFAGDIVGAQELISGRAKHLSGVTVSGKRLTIRLTNPSPDFLSRIAMPFFCAVPTNTPITSHGVHTPAAAGAVLHLDVRPEPADRAKAEPELPRQSPAQPDEHGLHRRGQPRGARNAAPLAAWDKDNQRDFFSSRVGCEIYQPIYTMDLTALCTRR